MPTHRLLLHSSDPHATLDRPAQLLSKLKHIGFLGSEFMLDNEVHYYAGERFMGLISFLGCSPTLAIQPEDEHSGTDLCHIALSDNFSDTRFLGCDNTKIPRCPHCRTRIDDWRNLLKQWHDSAVAVWRCPNCTQTGDISGLDWREYAGVGRFYLEIWGIGEGLAVPSDELLSCLHQLHGKPWRYFYCTCKS